MPSFKSCITSLALLAFAFAPVAVSAKGSAHSGLASRHEHIANVARAAPSVDIEKRSAAARRVALRKAAAAKKAATKKGSFKSGASKSSGAAVEESSTGVTTSSYDDNSAFMNSALVAAFGKSRCASGLQCNSIPRTPNSIPFCVKRRCTYRCAMGFAPQSDGTCAPESTSCTAQDGTVSACPVVNNGFAVCNGDGGCTASCFANQGDTLFVNTAGTVYNCVNTETDAQNCGAAGNACPGDYLGRGFPKCRNSVCSLSCPVGTRVEGSSSSAEPKSCTSV